MANPSAISAASLPGSASTSVRTSSSKVITPSFVAVRVRPPLLRVAATGWRRRGLAGTVINGICRDVALCLKLGYPVFSRDHWMRTGKDRVQVEATQVPVNIGEARVQPGDILRGDADGVIVIPREHEDAVLDAAEGIHHAEEAIRAALKQSAANRTQAAALLGISIRTLRNKLQEYREAGDPVDVAPDIGG